MSLNDPHLEAQMELESRGYKPQRPEPSLFRRRQALVALAIAGVFAIGLIAYLIVRASGG